MKGFVLRSGLIIVGLSLLSGMAWAQAQTENPPAQSPVPAMVGVDNTSTPAEESYNADTSGDRMATPPPVSGQTYPIALGSEERSNYLRAGLSFTTAYTDNALAGLAPHPISDISYSIAPVIALDETTSRMHAVLSYAPGYTFYQKTSELNAQDQNASIQFQYRLSPHVTFNATDGFHKSSNILNQVPDQSSGVVSGGVQQPNFSVVSPIANHLNNSGNIGLSWQYSLNDMIGGNGTFSNLHYLDQAQVPGLFDSSTQGGEAFYSHRVANGQYIGVTYSYQRLLAYPTEGLNETQTHAGIFFYTFAPTSSRFSISLFGGPQHADTIQPADAVLKLPASEFKSWVADTGGSLGWQTPTTALALSYNHMISSGSGLIGAVKLDAGTLSARQQLTRTLTASVTGSYTQNNVIGNPLFGAYSGHTISGTISLQQVIGQHLSAQLGYTRLHQSYSNIAALSANPDTNREFITISYQFSRPLGR